MGGYAYSLMKLLILLALFLSVLSFHCVHCTNNVAVDTTARNREVLEIGIGIGIGVGVGGGGGGGGGGESPQPSPSEPSCPPPPPSEPQPSDFPNLKQYSAYLVIQRFKKTITCDPNNVTGTWVGARPCSYTGFFCAAPPDSPTTPTIASVDFNGFGICAPTISGFVDQLPDLALFHANSNNLSGTIPDLTKLPYFAELDVSNNKMVGPFPSNVLPLANLTFLDIRFNSFSGAVPPSAFRLGLDVFFLNNNFFSNPLPADLGSTTAAYLTLANNGFTGPIPRSLSCAANSLVEVLFLNNRLSGCLPYEVGLLRGATVFDAGFNSITGPIPLSFACLGRIEQLNLAGNLLYGHIPELVCRLGSLENLSLSDNYFTSYGPSCWNLIKKGVLDVRRNCLLGCPDQRPPAECARFLARPKLCPFLPYIPCSLHAGSGKPQPSPPFQVAPTPPPSAQQEHGRKPAPVYMSYSAVHSRHGP